MPTIPLTDGQLHYQHHRGGSQPRRPPLVLIHGAGGNLMHWPGDLRRLSDRQVYALDLPGHGRSVGRGRAAIGDYAEVVREFVERLRLPPCALGGHSMGGAIALEFALRYPARLAGLVLVGTGARLRVAPEILDGIANDFDGTIARLADWAHGEHVDPNLQRIYMRRLREVDRLVIRDDFLACDAFDRRADVAGIASPTLIICGDADRMTPVKLSQSLAGQIKSAHLVTITDAGHMVMLEQPTIVAGAIREFLGRLSPA